MQVSGPFITEKFELNPETVSQILSLKPSFGFGAFSETVLYRTYSRVKPNGRNESWGEIVIRTINGVMSIRKTHSANHKLFWDENAMQIYASEMAQYMFDCKFLPPGRGLWACGTEFANQRGSAALNNCGATTTKDFILGAVWTMDMLMCGCGIGFDTLWDGNAISPDKSNTYVYTIPDSREGWVTSLGLLMKAYIPNTNWVTNETQTGFPIFDYSQIRKKGEPIRGFGGMASGPEPLRKLHARVEAYFDCYILCQQDPSNSNQHICNMIQFLGKDNLPYGYNTVEDLIQKISSIPNKTYGKTRLIVDVMNSIGACVVAGNVRRSAMLAMGEVGDSEFLDLKNYEFNPERGCVSNMSNNSVRFAKTEDFTNELPKIAKRIQTNGEPGIFNQLNVSRFGRIGRREYTSSERTREQNFDKACLCNPCAEIPLEPFELCCLSEIFPMRCVNDSEFDLNIFLKACEFGCFYTSTVSLLPTHWTMTNDVIAQNHRIGNSLSGIADFYCKYGFAKLIEILRLGYKRIRYVNQKLAKTSHVCESIRVTTNKPSGTLSSLVGCSPGIHFPCFSTYIRRMRIGDDHPLVNLLQEAGYKIEKDFYSDNTLVIEFPISQKDTKAADTVTVWEQFAILTTMQREWSDNMVSVTATFDPITEGNSLDSVLAMYAPLIKSVSLLPQTPKGSYLQMPYEGITQEEYETKVSEIREVNWDSFTCGVDAEAPKFCTNDVCEM